MRAMAIVSSKGQVTLPAKIRSQLGIRTGTKLHFELRGEECVVKAEPPISVYRGMLAHYNLDIADFQIPKEPDRDMK